MRAALTIPPRLARAATPAAPASRPAPLTAILVFLGAHVALGVAGSLSSTVATAHAGLVAVLVVGHAIWSRRLERVLILTAYGAVCDVYWRMTGSRAPWELSKYLLAFGALAILVRFTRRWRRPGIPVAFLACLLPGMVVTVLDFGPSISRGMLIDGELGLISLALGVLAFRQIVTSQADMWNVCWAMLGPVVAALAITTYSTATNGNLQFTTESNSAVTGGYGPNQVSSILGLGILLCVLLAFQRRGLRSLVALLALGTWCTWAAFLTFSRGGIYSLVLAGGALLLVGVGTRGTRIRSVMTTVVAVVGLLIVFASVNDFSGNWLDTRYSGGPKDTAGRTSLASTDLQLFYHHPLWGVGTEQSYRYHDGGEAAHTEFTRMFADHGLLGVLAVALLIIMLIGAFRASRSQWNRLLVAGAGIWTLTTMLHAATRIAAVGLLFALTQLRVEPDPARLSGESPPIVRATESDPISPRPSG